MENRDIIEVVEQNGNWGQSDFQSRYFVVNSQVTDYRRVRQAMLEIEARLAGKKTVERSMWKTKVQLQIHLEELEKETHPLKRELIEIDIDQCRYDLSVYEKKLRFYESELETFCEIVKETLPEGENLLEYTQPDEEKEREYWVARMGKQACMDIMTMGRISQGNLDSIAMMPLKDQEDTIKMALTYSTVLNKAIAGVDEKVKLELKNLKIDDNFKLLEHFSGKAPTSQLTNESKVSSESI